MCVCASARKHILNKANQTKPSQNWGLVKINNRHQQHEMKEIKTANNKAQQMQNNSNSNSNRNSSNQQSVMPLRDQMKEKKWNWQQERAQKKNSKEIDRRREKTLKNDAEIFVKKGKLVIKIPS